MELFATAQDFADIFSRKKTACAQEKQPIFSPLIGV